MAAEHAGQARGGEEDIADVGGYEGVALALMRAIARDEEATMILDVANRGTVPGLPDDAVVEVPVTVGSGGPTPLPVSRADALPARPHGPGQARRAAHHRGRPDRLPDLAEQAFARHPLVDSVTVARGLLRAYRDRIPEVDEVFRR